MVHLQPYLGYVVQFPLATPIPVVPGEVVALTVPTWAPVLTYNLSTKIAYRQSRTANCAHAGHYQNAQLTIGQPRRLHVRLRRHAGRVQRDRARDAADAEELRPLIHPAASPVDPAPNGLKQLLGSASRMSRQSGAAAGAARRCEAGVVGVVGVAPPVALAPPEADVPDVPEEVAT